MVEGPGCTLNGEKLRRLRGKKLVKVVADITSATKASNTSNSAANSLAEKLKSFEGKTLKDAESLGKELYVYFDGASLCLRLHFGMNGSVYVNSQVRHQLRDKWGGSKMLN